MKRAGLMIGVLVLLVFLSLASSPIFSFLHSNPSSTLHPLTLLSPANESVTLQVEWAVTRAEQKRGLMRRSSVDHGMLFVFEAVDVLTFWMKDTLVSLDIVFFDESGLFVSSASMTPCPADPCSIYSSVSPAKYALEMPAGFIEGHRIAEGWRMRVEDVTNLAVKK